MNKLFYWNQKQESRDAFLKRAALMLDDIVNGNCDAGTMSLRIALSEEEIQELKDYIFSVMYPELERTGKILVKKWKLGQLADNFLNQFYLDVWNEAYRYNNSRYSKSNDTFMFQTFASIYAPGALRKVKSEELGISRGMYYRLKAIEKTKAYINVNYGIPYEMITEEEISQYIATATNVDIKLGEISGILAAVREKYSMDAYDNGNENFSREDEVSMKDEGVRSELNEFFSSWSWVRKFIFCQNYALCGKRYENQTLRQLACDKYFVLLCEEDAKASGHVEIGDMELGRYYTEEARVDQKIKMENIRYVEIKYISNQRASLRDQFAAFVREKNFDEEDLSTNLFDLINEMWDELSDHMLELERKYRD